MSSIEAGSLRFPYESEISDDRNLLSRAWQTSLRLVKTLLDPLGAEQVFNLVNNQAVAADITGMALSFSQVSHGIVEFLIQRVTTGGGAVELITAGMFHLVYKPTSNNWAIQNIGTFGPSASGITFSVTAAGQVKYTSSNIAGTASISRIIFRIRTLAGKSSQYSAAGVR